MSITLLLVIITSLISYQAFNDRNLKSRLLHHPFVENNQKEYYRLISHGFIHGSWTHLIINMIVLYSFGAFVESVFLVMFGAMKGRLFFLLLYVLAIIVASIPSHFKHKNNSYYTALGASGATSGILFASVLFAPWEPIYLYFVIECPAIIAAILFLVYSSWASKNSNDNIGHDAHFYGAIFGFLFTIVLRPEIFPNFITRVMNESPFW